MNKIYRNKIKALNLDAQYIRVFDVDYLHVRIPERGDLYVTHFGAPFMEHLLPSNWRDEEYYSRPENKHLVERLNGSNVPNRITTQPVNGRSIDIVVKWCRVGQEVLVYKTPKADFIADEEIFNARWNGPFEEFGLLMELRRSNRFYSKSLLTQKPLAIYSPFERHELWKTGRKKHRMRVPQQQMQKDQQTADAAMELDMHRLYAFIYQWVKGVDAAEAFRDLGRDPTELMDFTKKVYYHDLQNRGYKIVDTKPEHFIVRTRDGDVLRDKDGEIKYSLIDFELLLRTPDFEKKRQLAQRARYWRMQYEIGRVKKIFPSDLKKMRILGVDYVYGMASNKGLLWVMGDNPDLFDFFDASRWRRTPRIRLSATAFRTATADKIQLVYRESRVGTRPQTDPADETGRLVRQFGYNSPFEEMAIAQELRKLGIPTVYPRAVYRTAHESLPAEWLKDDSRYQSHYNLTTPDGEPVLSPNHDYFTLWGYWRGTDPMRELNEYEHWGLIDLEQALAEEVIDEKEFKTIRGNTEKRLKKKGFCEPLRSDRMVLSFEHGKMKLDEDGRPLVIICINSSRAFENYLLPLDEFQKVEQRVHERLWEHGYQGLHLKGDHLLLAMNPDGEFTRDHDGEIEAIIANLELIRSPKIHR